MIKLERAAVGRGSFLDLRILAEAARPFVGEISALGGPDYAISSVSSSRESIRKSG